MFFIFAADKLQVLPWYYSNFWMVHPQKRQMHLAHVSILIPRTSRNFKITVFLSSTVNVLVAFPSSNHTLREQKGGAAKCRRNSDFLWPEKTFDF